MKPRHFLTLGDLDSQEFYKILSLGARLKRDMRDGRMPPLLKNRSMVMIFQKPSTRTRLSFEIGMFQLGGYAVNLAPADMQMARGESAGDTARTISRYADCIMARVYGHDIIEALARYASVPVINGLSNAFHPCQTLADFATILEYKKNLEGLRIAWIGDGNNVCNSMLYGAALSGCTINVASPPGIRPLERVVRDASKLTRVHLTDDPLEAARDADVVATDTFMSIHDTDGSKEAQLFPRYQVNDSLMSVTKPDSIFLHCLPATRGREVASSVIDGPRSAVWDQAENRLHTQKALLVRLLSPGTV